jgi:RNA polymerase sigma-70 factor (ECF subfamily)
MRQPGVTKLSAAQRADRLEELFEAHRGRLYALATRMAVSGDEATDLVQETFLRAAGSRREVPGGLGGERWLVRVLVNLCRDRYRRRAYRGRRRAELRPVQSTRSPEAAVSARDAVSAALAKLSPKRRAVVVLRELEDRDTAEVAEFLGMRTATVRWHLSRARQELRVLLGDEEKPHDGS